LANAFCEMGGSELEEIADFDDRTRQVLEDLGISEVSMRKTLESYCTMQASPDIELF